MFEVFSVYFAFLPKFLIGIDRKVSIRISIGWVDVCSRNESRTHLPSQAKCELFIGPMQFSNENSCSLTTSLWCVLTLRRVFTVCRLDFIWFGYSLSTNCIHYTPLSCTGMHAYTRTRTRAHLRLLTMFVLGQVNSSMKLSRKEKATTKATQNTKVFECIAFYSVARCTLFGWCSSLENTVLLCMIWWVHCVAAYANAVKCTCLST